MADAIADFGNAFEAASHVTYRFTIPIRTVSVANKREHWARKAKRTKAERLTTWATMHSAMMPPLRSNQCATVTLIRIAPRELDGDNLQMSFKACRDQIAASLGLPDDRDGYWVRWIYEQRKGKPREYAVEVAIAVSAAERGRG